MMGLERLYCRNLSGDGHMPVQLSPLWCRLSSLL